MSVCVCVCIPVRGMKCQQYEEESHTILSFPFYPCTLFPPIYLGLTVICLRNFSNSLQTGGKGRAKKKKSSEILILINIKRAWRERDLAPNSTGKGFRRISVLEKANLQGTKDVYCLIYLERNIPLSLGLWSSSLYFLGTNFHLIYITHCVPFVTYASYDLVLQNI